MKVALVIPQLDPRRGGAEVWTAQWARWLLDQGHEVVVVARQLCLPTHPRLSWHPLPAVKDPWHLAQAAEAALGTLCAEVVHDMGVGWSSQVFQPHGGSRTAGACCALDALPPALRVAKRWAGKLLPRYRRLKKLTEVQFSRPDRVYVALSRMVQQHFLHYHGVPAQQVRVVPNGVDLKRFDPQRFAAQGQELRRRWGVEPQEILLLAVAHNFRLKGIPELLDALRKARAAGRRLRLWVLGGKHVRRWQARVARAGLAPWVRFFGLVEDPRPFYAAADVLAHPTHYDPCSLVVLEGLAMGLPVLTTTRNGAAERMRHGVHGWVLPGPVDREQLALVLMTFSQRELLRQFRSEVLKLRPALDLQRNFQAIWACYGQALAGVQRPAA